jgi:hypothetical protein
MQAAALRRRALRERVIDGCVCMISGEYSRFATTRRRHSRADRYTPRPVARTFCATRRTTYDWPCGATASGGEGPS